MAAVATIASTETILRWYRNLVVRKYDGSQLRGQGRPKTAADIAALVIRIARENAWGYTRIKGALKNLGHKIGRNTIKRILQENGIVPAPERGKRMSWATLIRANLGVIVGMDFFTVEAATLLGLVRYHVLFAIDFASRKVEILGIAVNPGGHWMEQMARNLVDATDGVPTRQAVCAARPGSIVHASISTDPRPGWRQDSEVTCSQSEPERFRGAIVLSIKTECMRARQKGASFAYALAICQDDRMTTSTNPPRS